MADTNVNEHPAKRVKVKDQDPTDALPEPTTEMQSSLEETQATMPSNESAETKAEDASNLDATGSSPKGEKLAEEPKMIIIDPRGDVEFKVQDSDQKVHTVFVVCSRTLARVSPDWQSSLFPSGAQDIQPRCRTIFSHCKRSDALEIVLNVIHANTSMIPTSLDVGVLLRVLNFGRMYNITSALLAWGVKWYHELSVELQPSFMCTTITMVQMWLTNEIGLTSHFHMFMGEIAFKLQIDSNHNLTYYNYRGATVNLSSHVLQDEICIALLKQLRNDAILEQLNSLKSLIDRLLLPATSAATPSSGCQLCIYKWIGCIIQHLSAPHPCEQDPNKQSPPLWPLPSFGTYSGSIKDLRNHLETVQNILDSLEKCQGSSQESGYGRTAGTSGRGGRGGRPDVKKGTSRASASPCVPPRLLLASPADKFDLEIKKLKTKYEREHGL